MDKTPRKDLFWFVYRIVLAVLLVCGATLLIWISVKLKQYQKKEDFRNTLNVINAAINSPDIFLTPSPEPTVPPTTPPIVTPTPPLPPTLPPTIEPTPDLIQMEPHIRKISEEIASFISGNKNFQDIAHFFVDGTSTKKTLRNFVNEYYIHLTSYTLSEWKISDWAWAPNGDISCRVRFVLTAYWYDTCSGTDRMDYHMTLREINGEWLIYELNL